MPERLGKTMQLPEHAGFAARSSKPQARLALKLPCRQEECCLYKQLAE